MELKYLLWNGDKNKQIVGEKLNNWWKIIKFYRNAYTWIITRIGMTMSGVFMVTWLLDLNTSRRSSNTTSLSTKWHLFLVQSKINVNSIMSTSKFSRFVSHPYYFMQPRRTIPVPVLCKRQVPYFIVGNFGKWLSIGIGKV